MLCVAERDSDKCTRCGVCDEIVACSSSHVACLEGCVGCGACYLACPNEAIKMVESPRKGNVSIRIDGESHSVPERITVKKALEFAGYKIGRHPGEGDLFAPCGVGGCWSCAVEIDGEMRPSCVTSAKDGMEIRTELPEDYTLKRLVHGWMGHSVGGVGTPWQLKENRGYVEAAFFACGCNLRCPQCQNWTTTYRGKEIAYTPREAALLMTDSRKRYRADRMTISGGESTLNRPWLLKYIQELKKFNQDRKARFHVDTNASILTKDYIDELVEAGMTDIGPDLKGLHLETFMRITGLKDRELAEKYKRTAWEAANHLINNYKDEVFIGVGIPYNKDLISLQEMAEIGDEIFEIDPEVQVCVLDYRPEFRSKISRPTYQEMVKVHEVLMGRGLKTVVCQTTRGHIGPDPIFLS